MTSQPTCLQVRHLGMALLIGGMLCGFLPQQLPAQNSRPTPTDNPFPGRFPAPSLEGGVEWLNTSGPISLRDLRGKVVLLDFWTYCCINCMHVLPDLKYLEEKYKDELVVIGVHAAKFDNEKETENIRQAILRYEITHPVVNDANMVIAQKYFFNSWPTLALIDPEGNYVGSQSGEGNRELLDHVIGKLVAYHRAKGTLDETPVSFRLEKEDTQPTPLRYPGKVLADQEGQRLFIADSNHSRIIISSLSGELLDVVGTGREGSRIGDYDTATFHHPQGMALVGDTLYVADTENHLIRAVHLKGKTVSTVAGSGKQAQGRARRERRTSLSLNSPWDLVELNGTLYIAMAGPHQIWEYRLGSEYIEVFAGSGREDILDGPRLAAALAQPSAITTDGEVLYHVDSEGSAVRRDQVSPRGSVTTVAGPHDFPMGRSLFEFGDIDGIGDEVRMQHPLGLVYHEGRLIIADTYNDKIKVLNPETREVQSWLGTGERGNSLNPLQLSEPGGLDAIGDTLYIADTNNHRILQTKISTGETGEFVVQGLTPPAPAPEETDADLPFWGDTTSLDPVTVPSGVNELPVELTFILPEEHKLNTLAPLVFEVTAEEAQSIIPADALDKRKRASGEGTSGSFQLPLTGQKGSATITITLSYQYCREGTGGVCRFGSQQYTLPLTVGDAGQDALQLRVQPKN